MHLRPRESTPFIGGFGDYPSWNLTPDEEPGTFVIQFEDAPYEGYWNEELPDQIRVEPSTENGERDQQAELNGECDITQAVFAAGFQASE